jgi:hypothetical protein
VRELAPTLPARDAGDKRHSHCKCGRSNARATATANFAAEAKRPVPSTSVAMSELNTGAAARKASEQRFLRTFARADALVHLRDRCVQKPHHLQVLREQGLLARIGHAREAFPALSRTRDAQGRKKLVLHRATAPGINMR